MDPTLTIAVLAVMLNVVALLGTAVWAVGRVRSLAELTEQQVVNVTLLLTEKIEGLTTAINALKANTDVRLEDHESRIRDLEKVSPVGS